MANTIMDAGGLKYVDMQNGRFARKPLPALFEGGAWTTIRMCVLLLVDDTGANIGGTPLFEMGLCSGTTDVPGDATPTNAIGMSTITGSWTRSVTATKESYQAIGLVNSKNVAGVKTNSAQLANPCIFSSLYTGTSPGCPFFMTITKGSPNYALGYFYWSGVAAVSMTEADYIAQSIAGAPAFTNMTVLAPSNFAFDETGGTLDAAYINFNQASGMRVLDWRVVRLA